VQDTSRRPDEHERIPPGAGDCFIIDCGDSSWYYVSSVMARAIEGRLDRWLRHARSLTHNAAPMKCGSSAKDPSYRCAILRTTSSRGFHRGFIPPVVD
jgi:hypothetical protein